MFSVLEKNEHQRQRQECQTSPDHVWKKIRIPGTMFQQQASKQNYWLSQKHCSTELEFGKDIVEVFSL